MEQNTDSADLDMTLEESEHLAANAPKRPWEALFELEALQYRDGDETSCPEFGLCRVTKGYFATLDRAEAAMKELTGETDIFCFKIYELPKNRTADISLAGAHDGREYLYDRQGRLLDHTKCSAIREDYLIMSRTPH